MQMHGRVRNGNELSENMEKPEKESFFAHVPPYFRQKIPGVLC